MTVDVYNPFSLEVKRILVTGASSGIGRAIAIECSKMKAQVIMTARNADRLEETLNSLCGTGHEYVTADLSKPEDIDRLTQEVGKLDGLVNNAGFTVTVPVPFITAEKLDSIFAVNTIAPIMLTSQLIKNRAINKGGSIVFTASVCGVYVGSPGNSMYSATKGAINGFVKNASLDLAAKKIRVNAITPAMIETGILDAGVVSIEQLEADKKNYPLGRYGKPEEVAYAAIYLLSDASSWTTGTSLLLDGGRIVKS